MKYTVIWKPAAHAELAAIWNSSSDRQAVTNAADLIDHVLATSPKEQGESREGSIRILLETPIAVLYNVSDDDMTVSVAKV